MTTRRSLTYTTCQSAVGPLCVVAGAAGLRWIAAGERPGALVAAARARFPDATLRRDDRSLRAAARAVARLAGGAAEPPPAIARDPGGTPFQRAVWAAITDIPRGETRTYGQLARALGRPRAVRAVARACGANPLPLLVPCHRVVAADGSGGYLGGAARKRALLAAEGARAGADASA